MMMKTNRTDGCWRARAGIAGMLILGVLLTGCDKATQQQSDRALAGQASNPVPSEEKPDRDWSQPYQLIPLGDAIIKIPTGYILMLDHGEGNSKGAKENVILQASIVLTPEGKPKFLTNKEMQKAATPYDSYRTIRVDVNKGGYDFKKGSFASDERSVMEFAFSPYKEQDFSPPEDLIELGLKAYRHVLDVKENGKVVRSIVTMATYFPLDTNFKMPNGRAFYLRCDAAPTDPKAAAFCDASFVPKDRVLVHYTFPPQYLRYWKEIHQFVLNTLQFTN
jgi:hypothetical protein